MSDRVWCRNCNIETNEQKYPVCGEATVEDIPVEIYWCKDCNIPIIQSTNQADKGTCPICCGKTKYLTTDLRPVFPEERLLLEILLDKEPNTYADKSVWCVNSRYYINGKSVSIPSSVFQTADTDAISQKIEKYKDIISYEHFDQYIDKFVKANRDRLNELKEEAFGFVRETASIVNDIRNFVFGIAGAAVYGSCKRRKQKFVMSFTISLTKRG